MSAAPPPVPWSRRCYGVDRDGDTWIGVEATRARGVIQYTPWDPAHERVASADSVVAMGLHARESLTRWIAAPFGSTGKARRVLPALLDIELPFAVEDCACEFMSVSKLPSGGTRALAVAARYANIESVVVSARQAGFDPAVVDVEGLALWTQSLREAPPEQDEDEPPARVVVYLGSHRATLVLGRGTHYQSMHSLGDSTAMDMGRLLRVQFDPAPEQIEWRWAGPGAEDSARIGEIRDFLAERWSGRHTVHADSRSFLARALATRAISPGPYRCNLRKDRLVHHAVARRVKMRGLRAAALCVVAGLLLCAVNIAWRVGLSHRETQLNQTFDKLADSLAGYDIKAKGQGAVDKVRRARDRAHVRVESIVRLFAPSLSHAMQTIMTTASGHGLRLETATFRDRDMGISGEAAAWSSCELFIQGLQEEGFDVKPTRRDEMDGGVVRFTMSIRRR